jgi:hypothetical protein
VDAESLAKLGNDVNKKVVMVVVVDTHSPDSKPERRRFLTMPGELHQRSSWLRDRGVEEAVMESTARYWRAVWLVRRLIAQELILSFVPGEEQRIWRNLSRMRLQLGASMCDQ